MPRKSATYDLAFIELPRQLRQGEINLARGDRGLPQLLNTSFWQGRWLDPHIGHALFAGHSGSVSMVYRADMYLRHAANLSGSHALVQILLSDVLMFCLLAACVMHYFFLPR